ncbi:MAG: UDP-N-acetylmuramoyl-L-alanine--D-glutamate ligase [Tepidiformaceae bacterium]
MTAHMRVTDANGAPPDVYGKRVLVYSLGIEGRDLATWLIRNGASVTVSDTRSNAQLVAAGVAVPEGVERTVTGAPFLDPTGFDLLAVSQSVLRNDPAVIAARQAGTPVTSQMRLFLQLCPGKVVGITGSSGKTTTTSLVGAMAAEAGIDHQVGGNIGRPMLERLDEITPTTTVILEISHTQLQYTDRSPAIAAITNITPNHLDQFNWDEYVGLKRNLLTHQSNEDTAILNADDHTSRGLGGDVHGRLLRSSLTTINGADGAWLEDGQIVTRLGGHTGTVSLDGLRLRGEHNLSNVVMACAIASAAGITHSAMAGAIRSFRGVAHRLEVVGMANDATWVNDSIATSPERAVAGLRSFSEPVVLILGGRDKNLPLGPLQDLAGARCRAVVCFGESGPQYFEGLRGVVPQTTLVETVAEAVDAASREVAAGDVVLFSPAGTSFDAYPNFEARGEAFRALVRALPGFTSEVQP